MLSELTESKQDQDVILDIGQGLQPVDRSLRGKTIPRRAALRGTYRVPVDNELSSR